MGGTPGIYAVKFSYDENGQITNVTAKIDSTTSSATPES